MYKLGLTGSIGMGKSTTAQMLRDLGIPVWDADATVHMLYNGGAAVPAIAAQYPHAIRDGSVDRAALKQLIAEDPTVLKTLERIVHPLVAQDRADFLANAASDIVVFDIPLLFETRAEKWLDSVLVVSVPAEVQEERVLARGTMTKAEFEMIRSRQMPDAEKRERADHVIQTLTLDGTRADVANLVTKIREGLADA